MNGIDPHAIALTILGWLGNAVLLGTLLAGCTWGLVRILRLHARPGFEIAFWVIVLAKFVVPVGPSWSFSLATICERLTPDALTGAAVGEGESVLSLHGGVSSDGTNAALVAHPVQWSWLTLVVGLYVVTVICLAAVRLRSYGLLRRRCLALPDADEPTRRLVARVCRHLGVRRMPPTRLSAESRAPFVIGLLRPLLILSPRQLVRPDELETVIVHEVTHLRRGDMLVRSLQWIAGTVLFFWPVVAWVNRRIDRAREQACDERALRHGKLTAGQYARCLLNALTPAPPRSWVYQPACMAGNPKTIERRIDVILTIPHRPERRSTGGLFTLALLVVWGGFTLAGPANADQDATQYEPTEASMRAHADELFAQINQHPAGDLNGDGAVTKDECWAFIAAVMMQAPEVVLRAYPAADLNGDGRLDLVEAYTYGRGDPDIAAVEKKGHKAFEEAKKAGDKERAKELKASLFAAQMEAYHIILSRREALLGLLTTEPSIETVRKIAAKMEQYDAELAAKQGSASADDLRAKLKEIKTLIAECEEKGATEKAAKLREKAKQIAQKLQQIEAEQKGK